MQVITCLNNRQASLACQARPARGPRPECPFGSPSFHEVNRVGHGWSLPCHGRPRAGHPSLLIASSLKPRSHACDGHAPGPAPPARVARAKSHWWAYVAPSTQHAGPRPTSSVAGRPPVTPASPRARIASICSAEARLIRCFFTRPRPAERDQPRRIAALGGRSPRRATSTPHEKPDYHVLNRTA